MSDVPPILRRRIAQAITILVAVWVLPHAAESIWPGVTKYGPPVPAVILLSLGAFDIALVSRPERLGKWLVGGELPKEMVDRKKWNAFFGFMGLTFGAFFLVNWVASLT